MRLALTHPLKKTVLYTRKPLGDAKLRLIFGMVIVLKCATNCTSFAVLPAYTSHKLISLSVGSYA